MGQRIKVECIMLPGVRTNDSGAAVLPATVRPVRMPACPTGIQVPNALGDKLEIRAIFPDREMRISQFEELQ